MKILKRQEASRVASEDDEGEDFIVYVGGDEETGDGEDGEEGEGGEDGENCEDGNKWCPTS